MRGGGRAKPRRKLPSSVAERDPLLVRLEWAESRELEVYSLPRTMTEVVEEVELGLLSKGWNRKLAGAVADYVSGRVNPEVIRQFRKVSKTG